MDGAIDRILAAEEELIPSSGFLAATMEQVREEAAMPQANSLPVVARAARNRAGCRCSWLVRI